MPQLQVVNLNPKDPHKGVRDFFGAASNQYMESRAENMFNTAVEALGPDASEDDVMGAIQRTQGVSPQRKQSRINQYQSLMESKAKSKSMIADSDYKKKLTEAKDFETKLSVVDALYGKNYKTLSEQYAKYLASPESAAFPEMGEILKKEMEQAREDLMRQIKKIAPGIKEKDLAVDEVSQAEQLNPQQQDMGQQAQQLQPSRPSQYAPEQIMQMKEELIGADAPLEEFDRVNAASGLKPYEVRRQSMIDKYGTDPGPSKAEKRAMEQRKASEKKAQKFVDSINKGQFPETAKRTFEVISRLPGFSPEEAIGYMQENINIPGVGEEEMTQYYLEALNEPGTTELDAFFASIDRATMEEQKKRSEARRKRARDYGKRK